MKHHTSGKQQRFLITNLAWMVLAAAVLTATAAPPSAAQELKAIKNIGKPASGEIVPAISDLRDLIERYTVDLKTLRGYYPVSVSAARRARMKTFFDEWSGILAKVDFDSLNRDGQVDYILFKNLLSREKRRLELDALQAAETDQLLPFAGRIAELAEALQKMKWIDGAKAAAVLNDLKNQIEAGRKTLERRLSSEAGGSGKSTISGFKKTAINRAAQVAGVLKAALKNWFDFYNGYDPLFTWWAAEPYKAADQALQAYAVFLRERMVGVRADDRTTIIGDPIGREALMSELAFEMIPYTPEELIAVGRQEMAWCEKELIAASREMGFGDDWHKALDNVKNKYVEPGKQPELIRFLAFEAIDFLEKNDLVTIPQMAKDIFSIEMMTPQRQLFTPFFTGGETISVSYPTNTMTHDQKMMSLRGNNPHFCRATVHHELIPGHHLQGYMSDRVRAYRDPLGTAFYGEGWALYWELLLWDMSFPKSPEDKMGMLFWRIHRCARIIFSLSFHLDLMNPQECVDLLVQRVGHELDNATAEVRRSFAGGYGPLYQAAYMLGGLQLRALNRELVASGKMTPKAFHDAVLRENSMPIELLRAKLSGLKLDPGFKSSWRFYALKAEPGKTGDVKK